MPVDYGALARKNGGTDESAFRAWYSRVAKENDLDPNPDNPAHYYDYRAAFRAGAKADKDKHWPSEYKREGHPNLIVDGKDTRTGAPIDYAALAQKHGGTPSSEDETARRGSQSFFKNWMENAGAMYEGEAEGAPAQAKGAMTAAGMTLPGMGLSALASSAGAVGAGARILSDPRITAPISAGLELYRSGSPMKAAGAALLGSGGLRVAGKLLNKRAMTMKQAEEVMREASAAKKTAEEAKRIADAAARMRTSTPVPRSGTASGTGAAPGEVIPFPANPQQAGIAMRVSRPAPTAPAAAQPLSPTNVEQRVVEMATKQGLSKRQIVDTLKESGFNKDRGMASGLVDTIFKKHGITRR